jgi:dTDP-glucose 4,6-dehydratase
MKLLVCGGAGFIGSNFVRQRVTEHGDAVTVLDKLTYAGREENLADLRDADGFAFVHAGIEDAGAVAEAIAGADAVVNFAAETHVDRSIAEPDAFITTHAFGTFVLLEAARERGVRYVQVSTDEVYGSIEEGSFTESSPLQDPEKLIPLMVLNALHGDPLPVYGDGQQVRNWIYVEDFARGIGHVLAHGTPGETYNVGGPDEAINLDVVRRIIDLTGGSEDLIEYVTDRPGHDRRYSLGSEKVRGLGWEAQVRFDEGLERTVAWYRDNTAWWEPIRSGDYRAYYERQYGRALGD